MNQVSKRYYTQEQREEAVKLVLNGSHPNDVSKKLGIPPTTIYSWVARARKPIKRVVKKHAKEPTINLTDGTQLNPTYEIKYQTVPAVPVKENKLAAIIGTPSEIAEVLKNL